MLCEHDKPTVLTLPILSHFVVIILFSIAFFRTAWICDDAFITFRVIDNFIHGYGLTWNPGERVQVFTHPLWLMLLTPIVYIFRDPYYISIIASFLLSIGTFFMVFKIFNTNKHISTLFLIVLIWSRSFIDFSSSGLENAMLHFLIVIFMWIYLCMDSSCNKLKYMWVIIALLFLTRPDAIILVIMPTLIDSIQIEIKFTSKLRTIFYGLLPMILWITFSLFYYGIPFPNTALAKINTGISLISRFSQASEYLLWSFQNDRISICIILSAIWLGVLSIDKKIKYITMSLVLWIAYLFWIGADYMGGRFFSASVLISVIIICFSLSNYKIKGILALVVIMIIQINALSFTLFSPFSYRQSEISEAGIADERGFYYQKLGLRPVLNKGWKTHPWYREGLCLSTSTGVYTRATIGMACYAGGPNLFWVDPLALADPFLARLPSRDNARVGHYERAIPEDYLESILTGKSCIHDPMLAKLLNDVWLVTRSKLISESRLSAIIRINLYKRKYVENSNYDKNAIGLPGVPVFTQSPFSTYGIPYGGPTTWQLKTGNKGIEAIVIK